MSVTFQPHIKAQRVWGHWYCSAEIAPGQWLDCSGRGCATAQEAERKARDYLALHFGQAVAVTSSSSQLSLL